MSHLARLGLVAALSLATLPVAAQSRGDWAFTVGAHQVSPKSDNGSLAGGTLPVDVGNDVRPTVTAEYFVRDNLGVEVLAALPFEHDIAIEGLGTIGSTRHLPPTVTLQYHFNSAGTVSPFVGAGINYTAFFEEDTAGALAASKLSLDDSWGASVHAGLDVRVGERGAIRIDVRWMDIDSDVELDGNGIGTVNIDPMVWGAAWRFTF